jgi:hypothetical protein
MLAEELVIDDLEYTKPKKYSGVSQYARDKRTSGGLDRKMGATGSGEETARKLVAGEGSREK